LVFVTMMMLAGNALSPNLALPARFAIAFREVDPP